jgi:hypothetical protein
VDLSYAARKLAWRRVVVDYAGVWRLNFASRCTLPRTVYGYETTVIHCWEGCVSVEIVVEDEVQMRLG